MLQLLLRHLGWTGSFMDLCQAGGVQANWLEGASPVPYREVAAGVASHLFAETLGLNLLS